MSTTLLQIDGNDFTDDYARKYLHRYGHFGEINWAHGGAHVSTNSVYWQDAVERCQSDHRLLMDGVLGQHTARAMLQPWCGAPQQRPRGSGCHFPAGMGDKDRCEILYHVDMAGVRGIDQDRAHELVDLAAERWNPTAGSHFTKTDNASDANVVVRMKRLGASVLGLARLSCGVSANDQLFCYLQISAQWEHGDDGDFAEVCTHELGHNLGHDHENSKPSIMTTYAVGKYTKPTEWDGRVNRAKYGTNTLDSSPEPPIPDPIPPGSGKFFMIGDLFDENGYNLGEHEMSVLPRQITPI